MKKVDAPGVPMQPRHIPEVHIDVRVGLEPSRCRAAEDPLTDAEPAEDLMWFPRGCTRREPELDSGVSLQPFVERHEDCQAHRRRGFEENPFPNVRRSSDRMLERVNAADGALAGATVSRGLGARNRGRQ